VVEGFVRLSQSTGIGVEQLERLSFAAKAGGLDGDTLAKAFTKLDQALAKAAAGIPQQSALFHALGVSVKDASGNVRNANDVLGDLAERFSGMAGGASKAALAAEVFGSKNGAALIPLLNTLKETEAEADRLGVVINEAGVRAAAGFGENLHKLDAALEAVKLRVAAELGPSLTELTDQLLKSKEGADSLKELAETLAAGLKVLATAAVVAANGFEVLGKFIAANISAFVHLLSGDLNGALDDVKNFASDAVDEFKKAGDRLTAIWDPATKSLEGTGDAAKESADKAVLAWKAGELAATNYKEAVKELNKMVAEEGAKVASFGLGPVDQLIAKLDSGALSHGIKEFTGEAKKAREELIAIAKQLQDLTTQHANIQINFDLKQKIAAIQQDVAQQAVGFQNIGAPDAALRIAESLTGGFKDFASALQIYTEETEQAAKDFAASAKAQAAGQADEALHQKQFGEIRQANAEAAKRAAKAFEDIAKIQLADTEATINNINRGITAAGNQLASKLGDLGQVIQSGVQGFQSGGIYGAVAAVAIELFSRFKRFGEILEKANNQVAGLINQLSPVFETVTNGFEELQRALGDVSHVVGQLLTPIFSTVGKTFGYLAEIIAPIAGMVGDALQPLITILLTFQKIGEAIIPLQPAISVLATVFNGVASAILWVTHGIESAFADVLEGVRSLLASLGLNDLAKAVSTVELSIAQAAADAQTALDKLNEKLSANIADPFANSSNDVNDQQTQATVDTTTSSVGNLGKSATDATNSLKGFSSSLQLNNVPAGFKYNLRAFQAMGESGSLPNNLRSQTPNVTINVAGVAGVTVEQLVGLVMDGLNTQAFRNGGAPPLSTNPFGPHF
jgi:hypothetical protein